MDIKSLAEQFKKDRWEIQTKNLLVHDDCLGNGAFASVYRGTLKGTIPLFKVYNSLKLVLEGSNADHSEVAVKKLPAHANHEGRMDFFHEMAFMKKLGYHPHVISMLGCVSNPIEPLIVVEFCKHGDLLRFIRKNKGSILKDEHSTSSDYEHILTIKELVSIAWQVADGLFYLVSHKFIHRDVAARNILLTKNMCAKGGKLPIKWMSPESLKFYEYTEKTEIWSYGIALWEMFSLGEAPFPSVQPMEMIEHLEEGHRPKQPIKCPNECYALMKQCWEFKADLRPTFDDLRLRLAVLLNMGDEQYGYLDLGSAARGQPMGTQQLTYLDDECPVPLEYLAKPIELLEVDETAENTDTEKIALSAEEYREVAEIWARKKMLGMAIHDSIKRGADGETVTVNRKLLNEMRDLTIDCDTMLQLPPITENDYERAKKKHSTPTSATCSPSPSFTRKHPLEVEDPEEFLQRAYARDKLDLTSDWHNRAAAFEAISEVQGPSGGYVNVEKRIPEPVLASIAGPSGEGEKESYGAERAAAFIIGIHDKEATEHHRRPPRQLENSGSTDQGEEERDAAEHTATFSIRDEEVPENRRLARKSGASESSDEGQEVCSVAEHNVTERHLSVPIDEEMPEIRRLSRNGSSSSEGGNETDVESGMDIEMCERGRHRSRTASSLVLFRPVPPRLRTHSVGLQRDDMPSEQ
ncbi:unnamed protein product, partial [Mesorhabditis spiculigera]